MYANFQLKLATIVAKVIPTKFSVIAAVGELAHNPVLSTKVAVIR